MTGQLLAPFVPSFHCRKTRGDNLKTWIFNNEFLGKECSGSIVYTKMKKFTVNETGALLSNGKVVVPLEDWFQVLVSHANIALGKRVVLYSQEDFFFGCLHVFF